MYRNNRKTVNRKSNIELLRIISMIMILAHHYVLYGIQQNYDNNIANVIYRNGTNFNKFISSLLLPGGVVGVALFFLIAGYFGIKSNKVRIGKIIVPVFFYSILGFIVYSIILIYQNKILDININALISSVFPIGNNIYWFATTYVFLMLLKPFLNKIVNLFNQKHLYSFLIFLFLDYYFARFYLNNYLSIIEAVFLYSLGACIQLKKDIFIKLRKSIYIFLFILGWLTYSFFAYFNIYQLTVMYITIFGTLSAFGIFGFFAFMRIENYEVLNKLGSFTFDVYLIHEYPFLRAFFWENIFKSSLKFHSNLFLLYSLIIILLAYILCNLIAFLYRKMFLSKILENVDVFERKVM